MALGEGLNDSIFDSDDQLFGEDRQVAHYFRFNEILTGRTYGPHDTPDAPPTGPEIDVRWEDAYRIDPNASVAGYAGYRDKAVYDHAVAFNDAYAELLAPPGDRLQRHAPLHDPRRARDAPPAGSRRAALPQPAS